ASGLAERLIGEQLLVDTWDAPQEPPPGPGIVLEHRAVRFVSYAYEWPFTLLQRAALLHLSLLERLIPAGFVLQDGTPSNVMLEGAHPLFVDVGSIVPYEPGRPWQGLRQFLETMVYPLLLDRKSVV